MEHYNASTGFKPAEFSFDNPLAFAVAKAF